MKKKPKKEIANEHQAPMVTANISGQTTLFWWLTVAVVVVVVVSPVGVGNLSCRRKKKWQKKKRNNNEAINSEFISTNKTLIYCTTHRAHSMQRISVPAPLENPFSPPCKTDPLCAPVSPWKWSPSKRFRSSITIL